MLKCEQETEELTAHDFDRITAQATRRHYPGDELIFAEGDAADYIYFIVAGRVSIFVQKLHAQEEISVLGPGEYFGEMAALGRDRRSASARAIGDCTVLAVDKAAFVQLLATDQALAGRIRAALARRSDELALKESLVMGIGLQGRNFQVSIKGDPSLRETAFTRERHESIVDRILPHLVPRLEELLLNRCVYDVVLHFNSGEVVTTSVFDPFGPEIHPANRMLDEGYLDRHFPVMAYDNKAAMIERLYRAIAADPEFGPLADRHKKLLRGAWQDWAPLAPAEIGRILSRLPDLRRIPDFYLRNVTINVRRDAIRMQFNCDGTHIVGSEDYLPFIAENIG
jgi:CRP-like cAMP-binding protein